MNQIYRFFVDSLTVQGEITLVGDELHHLRVLRLPVGSSLELLDGMGRKGFGELLKITKHQAIVRVTEVLVEENQSGFGVISLGVLRGQAMEQVLPGLVELGVKAVWVFGQAEVPVFRLNQDQFDRWYRIIKSACKQSGRTVLPEIKTFKRLSDVLEHAVNSGRHMIYYGCRDADNSLSGVLSANAGEPVFVIGGEKGLSQLEVDALGEAAAIPVSFGRNVLRAKTAAIAAATLLSAQERLE